ncbi:terminase small subunit [Blautia sp.]|uniref:terminase small subunit n=1 Tax=Blautia sp. TaxID=1955243 RepID=UPI002A834D9F|nr:terminase small subunit [Blautia sp.]MDY4403572.1 terminase small subunit [Blautia sp.]
MARAPDKRIEQAKRMYLEGKKLVEIASRLNIPEGTIRRWKCTHKWDNERSDKKSERSERKRSKEKKAVVPVQEEDLNNPELTDKQQLFCYFYAKCFNATKAYQKAYGTDYTTAMAAGSRMLRNVKIKNEIQNLKQSRLNREMLDEHDIFQKYMDIAFADITDYVEFGQEQVQVMTMYGPVEVEDPKTGEKKPLMKTVNTVRFKESSEVDGTIISEVKQGKDGASIKLVDRMKALQWLSDHMDMATEEQRARIKLLNQKAKENEDGKKDALDKLDEILMGIKQNAGAEQKTE